MLRYVKGDILMSGAEAIAHGIAPNDDFKQGLALSLREMWPSLYKDFRHFCKTSHPKEGTLWSWKAAGSPLVINLFTQNHPSVQGGTPGKAEISYVNATLKELVRELSEQKVRSLAITRVACGVGGLSWTDVKPLLEKHLSEVKIPVYIYEEFQKGQKAEEK